MTQYEAWLKNEQDQIRDKFKSEREVIREQSFLDGFNQNPLYDTGSRKRKEERIAKLAEINQREEKAIDEFMRSIDSNWDNHVASVMKQK